MNISKDLFLTLSEISEIRYPNEACGILIGNNSTNVVESVVELENILDSTYTFEIDSYKYLKVEKWAIEHGKDIIGFFHSHPNAWAVPSSQDKQFMIPNLSYFISSVYATGIRQIRAYRKDSIDSEPTEIKYKVG